MTKTTATATGSVLLGLDAYPVEVTADVEPCDCSESRLDVLGLPEVAAREAHVRVRAALGFDHHRARVVVGDLPSPAGRALSSLDLPIAVAVMRAMGARVSPELDGATFAGSLGLDGRVRAVRGALCRATHAKTIALSPDNAWEAGLSGADVYSVARLSDLAEPTRVGPSDFESHVPGDVELPGALRSVLRTLRTLPRALVVGNPGSGSTMLARALVDGLEPLSYSERLEVARVYGAAGLVGAGPLTARRPFRAPHHSVSTLGLVGGGEDPRAGEVTLAHRGVLFLDELPEFRRSALETLATVLRDGELVLARSGRVARFPASPLHVVATANPCACGYAGHPTRRCACTPESRARWTKRLDALSELLGLARVEVAP